MRNTAKLYFVCLIIVFSSIYNANTVSTLTIAENKKPANPISTDAIVLDGIITGGEYDYYQDIGGKGRFFYYYSIIGDTIYMALKSPALGWISVGLGWNGKMVDSDTYTGYVKNGVPYMDDYWSTGDPGPAEIAVPDYDAQQDIIAFNGTEDATYTTMEWSRKLNTFDTLQDNEVLPGVQTRLMFGYHSTVDNPGWIHSKADDRSFTFYGNPSAPRNLAATFSESRVDLSWDAPIADGGTSLTDYKIYRSLNSGAYQLITTITNLSTTTYTDLTVLNGENYTYAVTASNTAIGHKESGYSNTFSVIPMGPLLNPSNLVPYVSSSNVTLTWDYPSSDGGIPVRNFKIYKSMNVSGTYDLIDDSSAALKYNDYDVINGYTYNYYVLAEHDFLTSSASNTVSANPIGPATPPLNLITQYTDSLVDLTWDVPLSNGGFTITGYNIYRSDTIDGVYSIVGTSSSLNFTDAAVLNGETYYYKVKAVNSAGESEFSNMQKITLALVPTTPGNLIAYAGDGNITLTWQASDPKGYSLLFYSVYRSDGKYNKFNVLTTINDTRYEDLNVTNSKTYYYKITANNSVGESSYSNIKSAVPAAIPSQPINLRAKNINTGVKLNWDQPIKNGGYFVSYYSIERKINDEDFVSYADSQSKEFVDKSIEYGSNYTYRLKANNVVGSSIYSETISIVPGIIPGIPTVLKAKVELGDVKLSWTAPQDGGAQITGYNVYRAMGATPVYTLVGISKTVTYSDDTNSSVIYHYKVSAVNKIGEGELSTEVSIIAASVSSAPLDLVGISSDNESVLLWSPPENDGGLIISSYNVYMSETNDTDSFEAVDNSSALLTTIKNLNNNQTYYFYITAVNEIGESNASNIVAVTPQAGYVDPSILINDTKLNELINGNNTNTSELDVEQISQTILTMLGIGGVGMSLFVIRMFIMNKFKKEPEF